MKMVHCYRCSRTRPETMFSVDRHSKDGHDVICRDCRRAEIQCNVEDDQYVREDFWPEDQNALLRHSRGINRHLNAFTCDYCNVSNHAFIGRRIARNGHSQVRLFCLDCYRPAVGFVGHDSLRSAGVVVDWLPYYELPKSRSICSVDGCDNFAVDEHHILPVHLAPSRALADAFGTVALCPEHHRLWHKLVTPTMFRRRPAQEALPWEL